MANVHDDAATGAEHPGFLQKIKDKLHIGHHHKESEDVATTPTPTPDAAVASKNAATSDAAVASTNAAVAPPVTEEEPKPADHHTTDLSSLAGHEGEHHGGVPTFLAALPDQDLPNEETKEKLHHVDAPEQHSPGKQLDSEELFSNAQHGEHHGGVPTFLVALPDQEIPAEVTKETAEADTPQGEFFDSEEVFSKAQQGEEHEGVPTLLVALPDQDLPNEETKEKLHHVTPGESTTAQE